MTALASADKAASTSQAESGPSSVPFRGSSVPRSRKMAAGLSVTSALPSRGSSDASRFSTWLLLDADDSALPFLRTLHSPASDQRAALAGGSSSPAGRSSEKLTESTNTVPPPSANSVRIASASSNVRSQASKYENGLASSTDAAAEKDRRMSLQHNTASAGKRGFMSRLRGTGGSVSSANVFNPPSTAAMSTSGSWSIVDPPTPIKEEAASAARSSSRTVHLAFTSAAGDAAIQHAQGLVSRASPSLLPSSQPSTAPREQVHTERLAITSVAEMLQAVQPEAVYIGSAQATPSGEALRPYLETLLSSSSSTKVVLLEPSAVRQLTPAQASTLSELARSSGITLLLPVRWASLWSTNFEETLLGLELIHDLAEEGAATTTAVNGDPDVSVDKSFDVSMSNIPTGLSGKDLNGLAELESIKAQVEQLKRELGNRDKRIAQLTKEAEEQRGVAKEEAAKSIPATTEPTTPDRTTRATPAAVETVPGPTLLKPSADLPDAPRTPASTLRTPTATSSAAASASSPALPVPSTSQHLTNLAQPPTPSAREPAPTTASALAPAASITSPSTPSRAAPLSPSSSPNSARSSGKVIAALTAELAETKTLLDATRAALSTARTQSAQFQAAAEEMRSTLSRARLENDSSVTILARKDRQIAEALERARKAESEAKELGRASREWGTRVREVEDELGKERIKRSRAEQAYEALSGEWKTARERLSNEVAELRESHKASVADLAQEYRKVLQFKERLKAEWAGYAPEPNGSEEPDAREDGVVIAGPQRLVMEITQLNERMQAYLDKEVQPLLAGLRQLERRENADIVEKLSYLTDELTRIKTLMRRGDITSAAQVGPSPL